MQASIGFRLEPAIQGGLVANRLSEVGRMKPGLMTLFALFQLLLFPTERLWAQATPFFYVNGRRVELTESARYAAVQMDQAQDQVQVRRLAERVEAEGATATALEPARRSAPWQSGPLLLLSLTEKAVKSLAGIVGNVLAGRKGPRKVPVYTYDGVDVVLSSEIIVRFKEDVSPEKARAILTPVSREFRYRKSTPGRYVVRVREARSLEIANGLALNRGVLYAEPNFTVVRSATTYVRGTEPSTPPESLDPTFPSDPYFVIQWNLENHGAGAARGADVRARSAWDITRGADTVTIAILDEGVDTKHPDLADKIVRPYNSFEPGTDQEPKAWEPHATACAGIAAAATNNARGIAGLAWAPKIMPVRIARREKREGPWITTVDTLADGIRAAVDQGADVLNNSWSAGESNDLGDAIKYALTQGRKGKGAVLVFAAGNMAGPVTYPARLAGSMSVIAVAATNEWDEFKTPTSKDDESWWGSSSGPEVTVAAPGVHILTTDISGEGGYNKSDYVADFNGTSSAAPHVAALAALIISQQQDWTPKQIREQISKTADDLGAPGFDPQFGNGRINAFRAVSGQIPSPGGASHEQPSNARRVRTSQDFFAIQYRAVSKMPSECPFESHLRLPKGFKPHCLHRLDKYGILLLEREDSVGQTEGEARLTSFLAEDPRWVLLTVYNVDGVEQVLTNELIVKFRPEANVAQARAVLQEKKLEIVKTPTPSTPNRYVVQLVDAPASETLVIAQQLAHRPDIEYVEPNFVIVRSQPAPRQP